MRLGDYANSRLSQIRRPTERAVCLDRDPVITGELIEFRLLVRRVGFNLMHGRHDLGRAKQAVQERKLEVRYSDRPNQAIPVQLLKRPAIRRQPTVRSMLGDDLPVSPVTESGQTEWSTYLPQGDWPDSWAGVAIDGGRVVVRPVPIDVIPIYIRAAALSELDHGWVR